MTGSLFSFGECARGSAACISPGWCNRHASCWVAGWAAQADEFAAIRADAEKWRDRAAADGGGSDPKAEETLRLLAEIDRLRMIEAEYEAVIQHQQTEVRNELRPRPEDDEPFATIIAPFDQCANCGSKASENAYWNRTGGWSCSACGESDYPEAAE